MPTEEQLERAIRDVDAHHARVIKEVEDKLTEKIEWLQVQLAEIATRLQKLERQR